ncbi:class I SAM-dependent methyltransferase [Falsiroseomonas oryziterrae]|uniref:class I SAM-dependent methyltransferase n=1 Tax=Falsiroseomonas oryziterrae TaxID=2911368 RepID=UPI0023515F96|nr:class I SAM-dependent methyltransferase [Roseomonas sp. NPKOSM-4]
MRPWLGRRILDVGAGIGATFDVLGDAPHESWLALEPDPNLAAQLRKRHEASLLSPALQLRVGTVDDLSEDELFDTILYIDVLEHIAEDRAQLATAARHLATGGRLVVLSPAHSWLFSPFDAAIGHVRRYDRVRLREAAPVHLTCLKLDYLDSAGLLASIGNRLLLRSSEPSPAQIRFWDGLLVPFSRRLDPLLGRRVGKSILGVWQKDSTRG